MPEEPYAVTCDCCSGRMFIDGELCEKCSGDGRILVIPSSPAWPIRLGRWLRDRWLWMRWFNWQ